MKEKKSNKMLWLVACIALTAVGFVFIPKLIDKYGNKMYKVFLKKSNVDIENLGPEIVKKQKF